MTRPNDPESLIAVRAVKLLRQDVSREAFLGSVIPEIVSAFSAHCGGLVTQQSGNWVDEAWVGPSEALPEATIGQAIDDGQIHANGDWMVAPLVAGPNHGGGAHDARDRSLAAPLSSALVIKLAPQQVTDSTLSGRLISSAELLASALAQIETQQRLAGRVEQLAAVLEAAAQWQRLDDDDELLREIADTATKLLNCERASIFLWDRRRRKLIGRPALGIEGKPLEVDDDAGVVGEVLRTAQPKIWNANTDDETRINRQVDRSLEFETHSLVAVPMDGSRGEIVGVFEAINHRGAAPESGSGVNGSSGFDALDAVLLADLASHAAVAIESQRKRRTLTESRDRLVDDAASATKLIGNHPDMNAVRVNADKVAATELTVLVLGNNGTGKEVLARHVHYESDRRNGPFVAVNCAALVESLLESELFGHEKGAFTDANQTRPGKFELADGGTLFLDEVGDMSPGGQAKLLRVLEDKVVVRVGGSQPIPVDVRVIAATNQPLEQLIAEKRFREDLFFRLNVVSLTLPPLSMRGDDVLLLAEHFFGIFCYQIGRQVPSLHPDARRALLSHPWPGNVRELRNTIERVCYLCTEDEIMEDDLMLSRVSTSGSTHHGPTHHGQVGSGGPMNSNGNMANGNMNSGGHLDSRETVDSRVDGASLPTNLPVSLSEATKQFQVAHIDSAIAECNGNMTDAAARLGLHRSNLYRKMRQLGMQTSGE